MAYKIPAPTSKSAPKGGSRAGGRSQGDAAPLTEALYQHLRSANSLQLSRSIRTCVRQATASSVAPIQSALLLLAAASGARALGEFDNALTWLAQANSVLPAFSGEHLAVIKREEVRMLLDRGELRAAFMLASQVDCTIIERGKAEPLVTRDDRDVSFDTLLLQAEVALTVGAVDDAGVLLEKARARFESESGGRLSRSEEVVRGDRRDSLRLLQALHVCRMGDAHHGLQMIEVLGERIAGGECGNRVLLAKCNAATGVWVDVDAMPPAGINIFEARRFQELARPASPSSSFAALDVTPPEAALVAAPHSHLAPSTPIFLPPEMFTQTVETVVSTMAARFSEAMAQVVAQQRPAPKGGGDGAVYGGRFPHFDLASVIVQAEMQRETGYVRVQWNTANVETTIAAGRLSTLARCGVGYVWLCDGAVVDATLCSEDPPPAESASERAALDAFTCLLQIGIGIGLDHKPDGRAFCYPDERARTRTARVRVPEVQNPSQSLMHALVVACETELGIGSTEPDIIGDWEK